MGVDLIDTPGMARPTCITPRRPRIIWPKADAAIVVLSPDPPITAVRVRLPPAHSEDVPRLLFAVNKTDLARLRRVKKFLRFLENELRKSHRHPEPGTVSALARQAMKQRLEQTDAPAQWHRALTGRLHYFAAEEKEQTLLQSVAIDLLRIAGTLRFAAMVGERARSMSGEDLAARKRALEEALARADQELRDLRPSASGRMPLSSLPGSENDLKDHVASAAPECAAG